MGLKESVRRHALRKPGDGDVVPEHDERIASRLPVGRQGLVELHEGAELGGEFGDEGLEGGQATGGQLHEIARSQRETAEQALGRGMGGVSTDDIKDLPRRPGQAPHRAMRDRILEGIDLRSPEAASVVHSALLTCGTAQRLPTSVPLPSDCPCQPATAQRLPSRVQLTCATAQ